MCRALQTPFGVRGLYASDAGPTDASERRAQAADTVPGGRTDVGFAGVGSDGKADESGPPSPRLSLRRNLHGGEDAEVACAAISLKVVVSGADVTTAWDVAMGRPQKSAVIRDKVEHQMTSFTNDYREVMANQTKAREVQAKITALNSLTKERFLHANVLNALQLATVEDVQLLHYRADQAYFSTDAVKTRTNDTGRVIQGKAATVTEKISIFLDGSDSSSNPGDQVTKFKELVSMAPYFREILGKTNVFSLRQISQPQLLPAPGSTVGKSCVLFTLESKLPEKTR